MSGYAIVELDVTDPEGFEEYRKLVPSIIEAFGGKYLVRGGKHETIEGDWNPKRVVVLEFESVERAKEMFASKEYAPIAAIRHRTAKSNVIIVEGA